MDLSIAPCSKQYAAMLYDSAPCALRIASKRMPKSNKYLWKHLIIALATCARPHSLAIRPLKTSSWKLWSHLGSMAEIRW
eukprot:2862091-Pyramimonas_sp.AAC.1